MTDQTHPAPDLHAVTLPELINELRSRCEAFVFAGLMTIPPTPDDGPNLYATWAGSRLIVRGMLSDLDDRLRAESRDPLGITRKAKG